MRFLLLLVALTLFAGAARAQDMLTKRNGDELAVKVLEITPTEVKYRRTDNPDGPLISVWRADVFMIRYANGTREVMSPTNAPVTAPVRPAPVLAAPTAPGGTATATTPAVVVPGDEVSIQEMIELDGPRFGVSILSPGVVDRARDRGTDLNPFLTQFGWQFENRLFRMPNGVSGLLEFVPLVGGLEQGKFIPSISGLIGIRGPKGFEFGIGPNVTLFSTNIVLAMGTSIQSNGINFPINLAVVPSTDGVRVSLLMGFNARRR